MNTVKISKTIYEVISRNSEDGLNCFEIKNKNTIKSLIYDFKLEMWFLSSDPRGLSKVVNPIF
jgi:hypothetical protein